jgi:ABC-2 type transport system ATP-binding protein
MLALNIQGLVKRYSNDFLALDGVDLSVNEGDFFALLGPNGAGKSTIIGIICSLVFKTMGKVEVCGYDLDLNLNEAKRCIGLVPQEVNFNIFEKVYDIVINQAGYYGMTRAKARYNVDKYLKALNLWDKRDEVIRNLSGGMKRRVMVARALIHEPKLLILDEPTTGVDIELRHSMWDFLKSLNENGTTVILTTHYLEEAEYLCNHVSIMDNGKVVKSTSMKELLKQLERVTMLLEFEGAIDNLPKLPKYKISLVDRNTLQIEFDKKYGLNELITCLLDYKNFHIVSVKNKYNQLEELFLQLTHK